MGSAVPEVSRACGDPGCPVRAADVCEIPRWSADPTDTVRVHTAALDVDVSAAAAALSVDPDAVVLAAHAKVLAVLTGRTEVATGIAGLAPKPVPCLLPVTEAGSWRTLVADCTAAVTGLRDHLGCPARDGIGTEAAVALGVTVDGLAEGEVFRFGVSRDHLLLAHRIAAVDEEHAARIAGYHRAALALLADDPDAPHDRGSLLSDAERDRQLTGLSGPVRTLPDRRAHELFEDRVRAHPALIAARCGDQEWTYDELNRRANRIAHAIAPTLGGPEAVVAVVTERNLHWMAAVLAILKAGAAYLPVEPQFPPDRVHSMLARSGCALVLTEHGSTASLDAALATLPGTAVRFLDDPDLPAEHHDPGIPVAADALAYLYFTSGSTGEPKGAMCEHAGMLNHLLAKTDDLGIAPGTVVAQTAPQCFDISLWQLIAPVMAGGTTVVVPQDVVLDVARFVARLAADRVEIAQLVPSYMDVLLTHLSEHQVELPDLRFVSTTGEALRKELAVRWFTRFPEVHLLNAYGLTETSDDTNHEVLTAPPEGERVPLGRPVPNVTVYVVDERLRPVPLGAVGEIVFSGVCVGRGYVRDPERTAAAFLDDPLRAGQRLYRSGDFGRWLPDGKLEFLGRRDAQVKVHGHRIEIGEIESRLLRAPGVRQAAVVVRRHGEHEAKLVAFVTAPPSTRLTAVREALAESLPDYMVPRQFVWMDTLPLSDNGKIERNRLGVIAGDLDPDTATEDPPRTPEETGLADVWADVLGVPPGRIGRNDDFFARGGTSLSALRLAARLGGVSLSELADAPTLAAMATVVRGGRVDAGVLRRLAEPSAPVSAMLVCFPYAGGNAVNYRALAGELAGAGIAVHGVEPPGDGPSRGGGPALSVTELTERVADAITAAHDGVPVLLWGHSAGAAAALAAARALQTRGRPASRLFVGAQTPGSRAAREALVTAYDRMTLDEVAAQMTAETGLDPAAARHAAPAYRHDVLSASDYLVGALTDPPAERLRTPLTVVLAADDPAAAEDRRDHQQWTVFADHVDLRELTTGGHHFLHTRAGEVADLIRAASGPAGDPAGRGEPA